MSFLDHTRRPAGLGGKLMVRVMNLGHRSLTRWGLSQLPDARCRSLVATDFSAPMLRLAQKKCCRFKNISFEQADILHLRFPDNSFDAVVAANVLHLLDHPEQALSELNRVCRPGGKLILPTYMNRTGKGKTNAVSGAIGRAGADFKREFTPESYRAFLKGAGCAAVRLTVCEGLIPCAVAVVYKPNAEEVSV